MALVDIAAAQGFARSWEAAWNAHDLDGVLAHFAEDAEFSSPVAAALVPGSDGVLRGRSAIRDYWAIGLERIPDLHFEVVQVYTGLDTVVLHYRNHTGVLVCEVLRFSGGLVVSGAGTYSAGDAAGASGARP